MFEIYKFLNDNSRKFLIEELEKKTNDKFVLERCYKEIDILYNYSLLPVIEYLYIYKNDNKNIKLFITGMAVNLQVLFVLGISEVDTIKYNLDYELYSGGEFGVYFVNGYCVDFLNTMEVMCQEYRIIEGGCSNTEEKYRNHYLIIPSYYIPTDLLFKINTMGKFETVEDYRNYLDKYLVIKIGEIWPFVNMDEISLDNVFYEDAEKEVFNKYKPKEFDQYVKTKSIVRMVIKKNPYLKLYEKNIKNMISNKEDLYEYLIKHEIEKNTAIDITNFIANGKACKIDYNDIWIKYVEILRDHKCAITLIKYLSNIKYLVGRGEIIEECLLALDKDVYINE